MIVQRFTQIRLRTSRHCSSYANQNSKSKTTGFQRRKNLKTMKSKHQSRQRSSANWTFWKWKTSTEPEWCYKIIEKNRKFDWADTLLPDNAKWAAASFLAAYCDTFTRQGTTSEEIRISNWSKQVNDRDFHNQNHSMTIQLKADFKTHKCGFLTVLSFSEHAVPIFARKKPGIELRLLVELRKSNSLIPDDYIKTHRPIWNLLDAAQDLAEKSPNLQNWLLLGISLSPRTGPVVSWNACFWFCQHKLCPQDACTGPEPVLTFTFKFLAQVFKNRCESIAKDGHMGRFWAPSRNRTETYHRTSPTRSRTGQILLPENVSPQAQESKNFFENLDFRKQRRSSSSTGYL